jgi:hypothetical protein
LLVLDVGWVTQLYADPSHQHQWFGSAPLERGKEQSPADGLDLWPIEINVGSHRFHERCVFAFVELTDGRDNEEQAPDRSYRSSRRPLVAPHVEYTVDRVTTLMWWLVARVVRRRRKAAVVDGVLDDDGRGGGCDVARKSCAFGCTEDLLRLKSTLLR